jgi:hypothetical protein
MPRPAKIRSISAHMPVRFAFRKSLLGPGLIGTLLFLLASSTGIVISRVCVQGSESAPNVIVACGMYGIAIIALAIVCGHSGAEQLVGTRRSHARLAHALATVIGTFLLAVTYASYILTA